MAAWSHLQSAGSTQDASQTSLGVAYTSNLSAGSKLIAFSNPYQETTTGVSDGTNSFTKIASIGLNNNPAGSGEISAWMLDVPSGDIGAKPTITATYSGAALGSTIVIQEIGGASGWAVDGAPATGYGTWSTAGNISCGAYSSSAAGEYLIAVYADDETSRNTAADPAGSAAYTLDPDSQQDNSATSIAAAYGNSTGGAETATFAITVNSGSGTNSYATILVALASAANPSKAGMEFPPSWYAARNHPGRRHHWLPRVPPFIFSNPYVPQQYTETLAAIVAATDNVQNNIGKNTSAPVAVTGAVPQRGISKGITAVTALTGNVTRQVSRVLAAVLAAITVVSRQVQRSLTGNIAVTAVLAATRLRMVILAASLAVTSSVQRTIGRVLASAAAVTSVLQRSVSRTVSASAAVVPNTVRQVGRQLSAYVTGTVIAGITKVKQIALTALAVVYGNTQSRIGKMVSSVAAVTATVKRNTGRTIAAVTVTAASRSVKISRTVSAAVVATSSTALAKVKLLTLSAVTAVTGNITRQVKRNVITASIISSGTGRTIGRTIQGNLISAGQTARRIGRLVQADAMVTSTVQRTITRTLKTVIVAANGFSAIAGQIISGALNILIPGSCARIEKGQFSITIPKLIMKLTGFPGTEAPFNIKIPVLVLVLTGAIDLRIRLPLPKVTFTGVVYPPLKIVIPNVTFPGLRGKVGHIGGFNIDFGNCADMWAYFMSPAVPVKEISPAGNQVQWIHGSLGAVWKTSVPYVNWKTTPVWAMQASPLSTQYVHTGFSVTKNGVAYNPSGDMVQFAFIPSATVAPSGNPDASWFTGSWETTGKPLYPYNAICRIGPNGVQLITGTYVVWVKVTDNPEIPVFTAGILTITN